MKRRLIVSLVLALVLLFGSTVKAFATDPVITITVSAKVIAVTNSEDTWIIGPVEVDDVVYFSATGAQNNTYSRVTNTGNVTVDVTIEGTDAEGGVFDWLLQSAAGNKIYQLYTNSEATPAVYDVEVKTTAEPFISGLVKTDTYDWSMEFTAPTVFEAGDAGADKTIYVTLVASE